MIVPREQTQERLAKLGAATLVHTPGQRYTLGDRLEELARAHPDRRFLTFEGRTLTYGELNAEANRVAHAGAKLGLRTGDVVALLMENRPEYLTTWMGLAKLGVTSALVNSQTRGEGLAHALETTRAQHLIVGSECLESLSPVASGSAAAWQTHVRSDPSPQSGGAEAAHDETEFDSMLASMPDHDPDPALRTKLVAGDDLLHIFTSGTTGLPKAARLSHMRYLGVGDGMSAVAGYTSDDVLYCVLPLYHGAGGMVVVSCTLAQGARMVLRRRFSATRFWDDVRAHGITACQYIGEICRYLLNQPPSENDRDHSLRTLMGAGLGPEIWEDFQRRFGIEQILEGWSSTEANTSLINIDNRVGSCGRIPFKELHNGRLIRYDIEADEHPRGADGFLCECDPGEVGEFIGMIPDLPDSGAGRFEGYTSAEGTERKILRDVFRSGDRWYRSGDLLRHDEDGYFYFVDRIGDTFRWKSENVSTQEVAESLAGFPSLEIVNVYGVRVPGTEGRAGMAALVLRDRDGFDGEAFHRFVEARLPSYAAPVFVRLAQQADLTSTFKLRKIDLQREGYDPSRVRDPVYVRDVRAGRYVRLEPGAPLPEL